MASGVSVKMGVTGVAQFKQGMKESQAAVKNLDQQLKLNEAQLKLTGNEELALQNKTALLTKQIEEQRNVVKQANSALEAMQKNGVSKTSTEFQKMQQQVYKASTDLMTMQAELQNVGESGEDAQSGVSHMNQALQRIGTNVSFENVVNGISKVTDGLEAAAKKAIELGKKLVSAMLSGGQWADDLQTTADEWEISPEQVYRMRQTANMIDTSAETIFNARKKLITAMGKESDKETMGAFAALGITYLEGSDANIERIFWKAGEGLMQMSDNDKVARNEYAMKLYGRSWEELIPIFKTGREEYERTMASWDWVGDQGFEALTKLDDESNRTRSAFENIQHTLEAAMAPAMVEIMQSLQGMMSEFNKYLQSEAGQEMLAKLNEAVSSLFSEFTKLDPEVVIGKITDIFESIEHGLQWIIDNKQSVFDALKLIAGGFALMKITSFAANIGRIVSGLQGLFGGGGGSGTTGSQTGTTVPGTGSGTSETSRGWGSGLADKFAQGAASGFLWREAARLREMYETNLGGLSVEEQQAKALLHDLGVTQEELVRWGQEHSGYDSSWMPETSPFAENLQDYYAEPMNRMTEVASETNDVLPGVQQSSESMTNAATALMDLPGLIQTAIANGMSAISIIIDASGIDAMQPRIAGGISDKLVQMTK